MNLLIVTAVDAEADALRRGLGPGVDAAVVDVAAVGVGPAAAAAGTTRLLTLAEVHGKPYRAVISAGIAGGIGVALGGTVLAARSIAADLGADTPDGFRTLDELGFGSTLATADEALLAWLRTALPAATVGDVLTVSTVTGTAERATALVSRYPDAVAEAMEGYGVACAAATAGLPFAELRTISNAVGPRDRASWQIGAALAALTAAAPHLHA